MKTNVIITWYVILHLQWPKVMFVMAVIKAVVEMWHKCEQTCSGCMSVPPCAFSEVRIPCESCNRNFRSQTCFENHKNNKLRGKTVCEQKRNCGTCGSLLTNVLNRTALTVDGTWRSDTSATYHLWRTKYRVVTMYYLFSTISRPRKIRKWPNRQRCIFLI